MLENQFFFYSEEKTGVTVKDSDICTAALRDCLVENTVREKPS